MSFESAFNERTRLISRRLTGAGFGLSAVSGSSWVVGEERVARQFPAGFEPYLRRLAYLREWLFDFLVGVRLATTGSGPRGQSSEGTHAEGA
jgi:hypothetical protein